MPKTSRATSQALVMSTTGSPVSSPSRNRNVDPPVSTISLMTEVVMISRRSRCAPSWSANRSRSGTGKYSASVDRRDGSSGRSEASTCWPAAILVWASSTASSGVVRPVPAERRAAISFSSGSPSVSSDTRFSRSSWRRYRPCTWSRRGAW